MDTTFILAAARAVNNAIMTNEAAIESLDRDIGDGDHYLNIRRGAAAIVDMEAELATLPPDAVLQKIGMKLLSVIGGASGPLLASFFMEMGKVVKATSPQDLEHIAVAFAAGVEAVKHRGKADVGEKTMLDVLVPVASTFTTLAKDKAAPADIYKAIQKVAEEGMLSTKEMIATKGRAAFLGERAKGHIDAGAKSSQVMITAVCDLALEHINR